MSLSSLFILSNRGDTIINRDFRYELKKGLNEVFFQAVYQSNTKDNSPLSPIFNIDGINYLYIQRHQLYFVLVTVDNVSPNYYFEILERLIIIIKDHCGDISEETIRNNFTLVYEIIDEMIDFGLPQLSSTEQISNFVFTGADKESQVKTSLFKDIIPSKVKSSEYTKRPIHNSSKADDNSNSTKTEKNDIFVDIIEKIDLLISKAGNVISSGVIGCIKIKSYLHNHPRLEVILSNETIITDYNTHRSVNAKELESKKTLTLMPPEGEFTLMNYAVNSEFTPPFKFITIVEESNSRLMLRIKLQTCFSDKVFAGNVVIKFCLPRKSQSVFFDYDAKDQRCQKAEYIREEMIGLWSIIQIYGGSEVVLDTRITLESNGNTKESRKELGPIIAKFDMPNYNVSKMEIKEMNIISNEKKYKANKWIKTITKANSYTVRIA